MWSTSMMNLATIVTGKLEWFFAHVWTGNRWRNHHEATVTPRQETVSSELVATPTAACHLTVGSRRLVKDNQNQWWYKLMLLSCIYIYIIYKDFQDVKEQHSWSCLQNHHESNVRFLNCFMHPSVSFMSFRVVFWGLFTLEMSSISMHQHEKMSGSKGFSGCKRHCRVPLRLRPLPQFLLWNISEVYLCRVTLCAYQMGLDLGVWLLETYVNHPFQMHI